MSMTVKQVEPPERKPEVRFQDLKVGDWFKWVSRDGSNTCVLKKIADSTFTRFGAGWDGLGTWLVKTIEMADPVHRVDVEIRWWLH